MFFVPKGNRFDIYFTISVIVCLCMYVWVNVLFWISVWPFFGKKLSFWLSACSVSIVVPLPKSFKFFPFRVNFRDLLLIALWFILRGDLLYVFPCVILFLSFSVLLVLRLPRLGKRELILVLFVRLFGLCLFRFVGFLFLLGSGKGCGL